MSEALHTALVKAQSEFPTLPKDGVNPHFSSKFTTLDAIKAHTQPVLSANGLAWSALPSTTESGAPSLRYRLMHVSGDSLEDTMPLLLPKADSQGLGAALTYARRYAIVSVLNLVADEDDDGNRASTPAAKETTAPFGEAADKDLLAAASAQLRLLVGQDNAPVVWGELKAQFGYMPSSVALTLVKLGNAIDGPPVS